MNKKLIRLTESDLHRIVKESVNKIIKEWGEGIPDPSDDVGRKGYDPSAKDNEHEQYEDELGWEEAYYRNKYGD